MERALLSSYLCTKYLTPNGIFMLKGDEESYNKPATSENMAYSIVMN